VRTRLTTWLSALLLFNAVFNVPVARIPANRVSFCVVYSEQKRHRAEQVSEAPAAPRPAAPAFLAGPARDRAAVLIIDSALFQRPPPAIVL